jgi:hypothetical protein
VFSVEVQVELWKILLDKISNVKALFLEIFGVGVRIKLQQEVDSKLGDLGVIKGFDWVRAD